jgi:hypothetical protein
MRDRRRRGAVRFCNVCVVVVRPAYVMGIRTTGSSEQQSSKDGE